MTSSWDGLPANWVISTLGDVRLDLSKTVDPRKHPDEQFELYSVPSYATLQPEIVYGHNVGSSKRTVPAGSVLLCKINPRINRVWVVGDYSPHEKITSTEWLCFSQIEGLEPRYLCYRLQQSEFRDYLASNASGVGGSLMRVRASTFADYPFPLPPLPEQRRIVAAIERHFSRLDAAVASLQRAQANLARYRASVLKAACEGELVPTEAHLAKSERRDYEPADRLAGSHPRRTPRQMAGPGQARPQVQRTRRAGHVGVVGTAGRVDVGVGCANCRNTRRNTKTAEARSCR